MLNCKILVVSLKTFGVFLKLKKEMFTLPANVQLGSITFGCTANPFLVSLQLADRDNNRMHLFRGSFKVKKENRVNLAPNEHIVGADVETNGGKKSLRLDLFRCMCVFR